MYKLTKIRIIHKILMKNIRMDILGFKRAQQYKIELLKYYFIFHQW